MAEKRNVKELPHYMAMPVGSVILSVVGRHSRIFIHAIVPDTDNIPYKKIQVCIVEMDPFSNEPYPKIKFDMKDFTFLGSVQLMNPQSASTFHVFYKDEGYLG